MSEYLMTIIEFAVPCLIMWGILMVSMALDRSRYRNCVFLTAALLVTIPFLCSLAGDHYGAVLLWAMVLLALLMLFTPAALIINGVIMLRREGHSLANILSLLMGILIGIGDLSFFALFLLPILWSEQYARFISHGVTLSLIVGTSILYVSLSFGGFALYTLLLQVIPRRRDFDYVIIHGSGLLDGERVPKLLSDRLDKAIEVYLKDPTPPYLVPSGGQGPDETISEAEAMKRYLIGKGVPEDRIIKEDQSRTTRENVANSKRIIEAREGRHYTALVTSNYHVYRALRYARDMGFKCTGIGAHVAPYYWPSALIREYAAIHSEPLNLAVFVIGWIVSIVMVVLFVGGTGGILQ